MSGRAEHSLQQEATAPKEGAGSRYFVVIGDSTPYEPPAATVFAASRFSPWVHATLQGLYWSSASWADYDVDGDMDLIVLGDYEEVHHTILYNCDSDTTGTDQFTEVPSPGFENIRMGTAAWGDYDNDGDPDLLLVGQRGGHGSSDNIAELYRNDPGTFVNVNAGLMGLRHARAVWGDYDGDGDLDLLMTGTVGWDDAGKTILYANNNGAFAEVSVGLENLEGGTVAWGDYDNDGDLDILLTGAFRPTGERVVRVYRNDSGWFVDIGAGILNATYTGEPSAAWGDYDSDGKLDIVFTGCGLLKVFRNQAGAFVDMFSTTGIVHGSVEWADLNRDGMIDILLAGQTEQGNIITEIYRNNLPHPADNLIHNGDFLFGTESWQFYTNGNATFRQGGFNSFPCCVHYGEVLINTPGSNTQMYQTDIVLEPCTQYTLEFYAYSTGGRKISVSLTQHGFPYTIYGLSKTVTLGTSMQLYTFGFTTANFTKTVGDARLRFGFSPYAQAGDEYGIMDVYLRKVGNTSPTITQHPQDKTVYKFQTATFTVAATGTAPISYQWQKNGVNIITATNASYTTPSVILGDEGTEYRCVVTNPYGAVTSNTAVLHVLPAINFVQNPGFESGTQSWSFYSDGTAALSIYPHSNINGEYCGGVAVTTAGNNVQLFQTGILLEQNTTYQLAFSGYSTTGHNMAVFLTKHTSPYTAYGINNWIVDLTTEWQGFSKTFTTPAFGAPTTNTRLRFWFAPFDAAGDQFFIDDLWLAKVGPGKEGESTEIPDAFALHQNYPNPFNPLTIVNYQLPVESHVTLKIYDMLGREVMTLVDEVQEAGYKAVEWDATGFASGVYLYRLQAGEFIFTKKLVLMK